MFFLLILFVIYFQSPLSQINEITVEGNKRLEQKTIIQISGLKIGESIWGGYRHHTLDNLNSHPEIKKAEVDRHLPNKVGIKIEEFKRVAFLSKENRFIPVLENGAMLDEQITSRADIDAPILIGFKKGDKLKDMITELSKLPEEIIQAISEIHFTPKKTEKHHITLYMNDGFEVTAAITTFSKKMIHYPSIVSQLDPNVKGVIDLEVGSYFKAYEVEEEGEGAHEEENEG